MTSLEKRSRRRAGIVVGALLVVASLAAGLVLVRTPRSPANAQTAVTIQRAHAGEAVPSLRGRITFLVIGSDSGAPKFGRGGSAEGGRADSIHLVVFDTAKQRGISIGFPRDSYVPIPGRGTDKINAAMASGGPRLLVSTVEQVTGIKIDYYALTSFDGLTDLVNKVGGVEVGIDQNMSDSFAGAFFRKGTRKLNGGQALAYARARKTLPDGDFGRSRHQGQIILGGLATFQKRVAEDPAQVMGWLAALNDEVKTDLPFPETVRLALLATQVKPSWIRNVVAPGVAGSAGAASVVRLTSGAYSLFAQVRRGDYG